MAWWHWIVLGIVLLAGELITPGGFFVVFFGLASLVVGLLVALGVAGPGWAQWGLFSVLSVLSLVIFRKKLLERFKPGEDLNRSLGDVIGGVVTLADGLAPGAIGKVEFRGTPWSVRNASERPLEKGQRCTIERVDGLMLLVRSEDQGSSRV